LTSVGWIGVSMLLDSASGITLTSEPESNRTECTFGPIFK
jgi:hypothetical protein